MVLNLAAVCLYWFRHICQHTVTLLHYIVVILGCVNALRIVLCSMSDFLNILFGTECIHVTSRRYLVGRQTRDAVSYTVDDRPRGERTTGV